METTTKTQKQENKLNITTPVRKVSFTPGSVFKYLTYVVIGLTTAFLSTGIALKILNIDTPLSNALYDSFHMDREMNVPSGFSFLILITTSFLLFILCKWTSIKENKPYWLLMSFLFLFISFDELMRLHEQIGVFLDHQGGIKGGWKLPYGIIGGAICIAMLRFLLRLPKRTMLFFICSGIAYIICSVGIDSIQMILIRDYNTTKYQQILTLIEEPGEMMSIITFIYSILDYASPANAPISIAFKNEKSISGQYANKAISEN